MQGFLNCSYNLLVSHRDKERIEKTG